MKFIQLLELFVGAFWWSFLRDYTSWWIFLVRPLQGLSWWSSRTISLSYLVKNLVGASCHWAQTLPNSPTKYIFGSELFGQATRQKAAPCLLSINQVRLRQPVVLHHPGGGNNETGVQCPEMVSYLYPALMVACEGSCSRVSNQSDSKDNFI